MIDWLNSLDQRERIILAVGVITTSLLLLFEFVWSPLTEQISQLETQNESQQVKLKSLKDIIAEYHQIQQTPKHELDLETPLFSLIEQSSNTYKIHSAIKSMTPEGSEKIHIQMDNVSFDQMIKWLAELSINNALQVSQLSLTCVDEPGFVNANFKLMRDIN